MKLVKNKICTDFLSMQDDNFYSFILEKEVNIHKERKLTHIHLIKQIHKFNLKRMEMDI